MLGLRTHRETLDSQDFNKATIKVIGIRMGLSRGLGVIHPWAGQEIRLQPRILKVELRMLALRVEGFMEIDLVSLRQRLALIVGDWKLCLKLYVFPKELSGSTYKRWLKVESIKKSVCTRTTRCSSFKHCSHNNPSIILKIC